MRYFIRLEGEDTVHEVVIDGDTVRMSGVVLRAHLEELEGTSTHLLKVDNEVHRVSGRRGGQRGIFELTIGGYRLSVEALDERTRRIRDLSGASARRSGPTHLTAPMPGLIVRVAVNEGDSVRAGQGVVVMEAMKMENELRAIADGRVRRVLVSPGNAVEKGAMLLEMEG